ncbi:60S ribosomal protein L18a-like protein isoform X2 [Argentina anserina]|nr:60S ribosomal protein L18a-like protein isoform X2 [Potentilla anserina]
MDQKLSTDAVNRKNGNYVLIGGPENPELEKFDKPLPYCGCGIGWFSFLLGFVFPVMWYYAAFLYFWKYYDKDPRERSGLGASAVAALVCTVGVLVAATVIGTKSLLP